MVCSGWPSAFLVSFAFASRCSAPVLRLRSRVRFLIFLLAQKAFFYYISFGNHIVFIDFLAGAFLMLLQVVLAASFVLFFCNVFQAPACVTIIFAESHRAWWPRRCLTYDVFQHFCVTSRRSLRFFRGL